MTNALVLGGGGIAGICWEAGILLALGRAGVDVTDAQTVVGTSAGSVVGTLVATGVDLEQALLDGRFDYADTPDVNVDLGVLVKVFAALLDDSVSMADRLRQVGVLAESSPTGDESERLAVFARRLPKHEWPQRRLLLTAVDTRSGELMVWHKDSGVPLIHAVASSCAVPGVYPPVHIGQNIYMDGGMYSGTHVPLADGARRVLVLAPLANMSPLGAPASEIEQARAGGAEVLLIAPDERSAEAFGVNVLDKATAAPSLAAGLAQGAAVADQVRALWQ